jgi:pimeloyl-ACP methyl ester carboxylesterase
METAWLTFDANPLRREEPMNRRELLIQGAAGGAAILSAAPAMARVAAQPEWTPAQFHAARRFADLEVGRVAYVERGTGPAAIFLHGYPLNGFQWRGPIARLAGHRRCIAVDLLGLGYSELPADADLSPIAQSAMIVAFMDKLGIPHADILSNDSATGVAQLIAATHPERVRTLLLTNGDVGANSPPEAFLGAIDLAKKDELDDFFERHLTDNDFARSDQGVGRGYAHPDRVLTHEVLETYLRPLVSSDKRRRQGQGYATAMLPNPLPAAEPGLRAFDKPVRMVWGRNNELFPDQWALWLDQTFPKSQGVRFVEDVKLFFPEEQPELIAEEARKLWRV